jgi:hypothetical protein
VNVSATLYRIDEIAAKIATLGRECADRTVQARWECPRGKRAERKAEELSRAARRLAGEVEAVGAQLRTVLAK